MERYLNAQQAAEELDISLQTLYAYVSRGLIRSEAMGGSKRNRRYNAEDVNRLKERREGRRNPDKLAESALHFGTPLLDSAITLIEDGRLYYRGLDATELALHESIERVAALIWTSDLHTELYPSRLSLPPRWLQISPGLQHLNVFERFQVVLPLVGADDFTGFDLRPASVIQTGVNILRLLAMIAADREMQSNESIAAALCQSWQVESPLGEKLLDAALILCADHELNISAFAARCVASAGSTPYAAVSAGLAALQGTKHGGNTSRVAALLREVGSPDKAARVISDRLKRGEAIPGFGHRLYPGDDPRAQMLLTLLAEVDGLQLPQAIIQSVDEFMGEKPNIDFALVALEDTLNLPDGSALTLFALGRTVGWMGHALEQYETDRLIRPRARYTGVAPVDV